MRICIHDWDHSSCILYVMLRSETRKREWIGREEGRNRNESGRNFNIWFRSFCSKLLSGPKVSWFMIFTFTHSLLSHSLSPLSLAWFLQTTSTSSRHVSLTEHLPLLLKEIEDFSFFTCSQEVKKSYTASDKKNCIRQIQIVTLVPHSLLWVSFQPGDRCSPSTLLFYNFNPLFFQLQIVHE